jgi:thiol:disulfide interchange protein DsbA
MLHAKTYFALEVMGEAERLHGIIFDAMHVKKLKLDTLDEMTAFLEGQGVDGKKFREALDSFAVQTQLNRATVLARRYGIRSVPTLIVDGRYKSGKGFNGYGEFTELVDYLAAKTVKERQAAAASQ